MSHQFYGRMSLAICISVSLIACNSNNKSEEKKATTDTTKMTQTTQPSNPDDMNAAKVAPNLYKVVADTMGIRMVEVNYNPGDSSAMHWHPDYAAYVVEGGTVTFYSKDGSKMDNTLPSGAAMIRAAEWHAAKNTGKTPFKVILVEVNRSGAMMTPDPKTDATKVAGNLYKKLVDTLGLRVLQINYKPGQQSAMHAHGDCALYVTNDGTAEFTGADGKKQKMEFKKGQSYVVPAVTHSVKNVGKTTMQGILVEVNRAMK